MCSGHRAITYVFSSYQSYEKTRYREFYNAQTRISNRSLHFSATTLTRCVANHTTTNFAPYAWRHQCQISDDNHPSPGSELSVRSGPSPPDYPHPSYSSDAT